MEACVDTGISGAGSREQHWYESPSSKSWWHDTNWFRVAQQTQQQVNNERNKADRVDSLHTNSVSTSTQTVPEQSTPPTTATRHDRFGTNGAADGTFAAMLRHQNSEQQPHQALIDQLQPIVAQGSTAEYDRNAPVEWHPTDKQKQRYADATNNIQYNNLYNSHGSGDSALYAGGAATVMNRFNTSTNKRTVITTQQRVKAIRIHALESLHSTIRRQIEESIVLPLLQPNLFSSIGVKPACGVLLSGSSGAGKTRLMTNLLRELGIYHHQLDASQLLAELEADIQTGNNPHTNGNIISNMFSTALKHAPSVLLIDDIDIIAAEKQHDESSTVTKIRGLLKTSMDSLAAQVTTGKPVIVIGTTSMPDTICASLTRLGRFDRHIRLSKPDAQSRLTYLKQFTKDMKLAPNVDLRSIAADAVGYIASDLASLCSEAGLVCIREQLHNTVDTTQSESSSTNTLITESISDTTLHNMTVTQQHFVTALKLCRPSSTRGVADAEIPNVQWSDIGGQDALRDALTETIQWPLTFPQVYKAAGVAASAGVLLWGPPGCGKTLLAQAVATECQASFISVKGPELLSPYIGQSESNIRQLFTRARASAPCVIFLDEVDSIGRSRAGSTMPSDSTSDRVLTQILTELDTRLTLHDDKNGSSSDSSTSAVFVIAATNRPEVLDPALIRPGRFDQLVYVGLPSLEGRVAILKACLLRTPLQQHIIQDEYKYLHSLAERTDGYSGADLANLCRLATKLAIQRHIKHQTQLNTNLNDDNDSDKSVNNPLQHVLGQDLVEIEHFERALLLCRPSVGTAELMRYAMFGQSLAAAQQPLPSTRDKASTQQEHKVSPQDTEMDDTSTEQRSTGRTRDELLADVTDSSSSWRAAANSEIQQNKALKRGIVRSSDASQPQHTSQQALHNIIQAFQLYKQQAAASNTSRYQQ